MYPRFLFLFCFTWEAGPPLDATIQGFKIQSCICTVTDFKPLRDNICNSWPKNKKMHSPLVNCEADNLGVLFFNPCNIRTYCHGSGLEKRKGSSWRTIFPSSETILCSNAICKSNPCIPKLMVKMLHLQDLGILHKFTGCDQSRADKNLVLHGKTESPKAVDSVGYRNPWFTR